MPFLHLLDAWKMNRISAIHIFENCVLKSSPVILSVPMPHNIPSLESHRETLCTGLRLFELQYFLFCEFTSCK